MSTPEKLSEVTDELAPHLETLPKAILALTYGDCGLAGRPSIDSEYNTEQAIIVAQGADIARELGVPLLLPKGIAGIDEIEEVEVLQVSSKTANERTMNAESKYFKKVRKALIDTDSSDDVIEIIVVGSRLSHGAVSRHCENNRLHAVEVIDCFSVENH